MAERRRRQPHGRVARRQPRLDGRVRRGRSSASPATCRRLRAYYLWSRVTSRAGARRRGGERPAIVSRQAWGADEKIVRATPLYAPDAPARGRAPHGGHELLHARAGGGDRARDRGLPRAGERLERHRLQLPRRPFRHGLRGPRRRHRPQRDRRARAGLQHRHGRRRADRQLLVATSAARHSGTRSSGCSRGGSTSRTSIRSRPSCYTSGRQREVPRREARDAARDLRASRHRPERVPRQPRLRAAARADPRVAATGLPKLYAPTVAGRARRADPLPGAPLLGARRGRSTVTDATGKVVASGHGTRLARRLDVAVGRAPKGAYTWTIARRA